MADGLFSMAAARGRVCALGAALACTAPACTGEVADGSTGSSGGSGGSSVSGSGPSDPRISQRIWRLSPSELNREVTRLFGAGAPEVNLPQGAAQAGITNIAENGAIDQGNASVLADGVRAVASWVVADGATRTRCEAYGDTACVDTLLGWLPSEAFRRPVDRAEVSELRELFDQLNERYEYDYALAGTIRAVLLSPDFLYRTELGTVLSPFEIANLLAFAITEEAPDVELLTAAQTADLTDPDVREVQARRLMDKSEKVWQRFFWEWLHMATLDSQGAEVGLPSSLVAQMEEEYRAFIREVVVNEHGTLRDVLSAPYTWAQPELAEHYDASHPGTGLERIELDEARRGGILTQGAWLVSHGKDGHDNVVRRGMSIFKDAMCNNNLRPPEGVDVLAELAKLVGPDATVREVVEARGSAAACMGCHRLPDPMGMVFETFTSDGRFQDTYPGGLPIDSNVTIPNIGSFDNARLLAEALADDEGFQRCFVRRFTHLIAGIDLGASSRIAWLETARERLVETDGNLEEMLVALVRHPAFIERQREGAR